MTRSLLAMLFVVAAAARAEAAGVSFTPVSLRFPVQEIGLIDGVSGTVGPLWQCSAWRQANTGCYVDFMNKRAVAGLFQRALATLPAAKYSALYRNHCPGVALPSLQVKGTATLDGVRYYTTSDAVNPLSADPKQYGYAEVALRNCIDFTTLPRPVTVSEERVAVDIIYFARDIAYVMEGGRVSGGMGLDGLGRTSCKQGARHALCVNALDLLAYDGRLQEKTETYYLGPPSRPSRSAFAQMHLAFDAQDRFVGGVTQVYFEAGSEVPWPAGWGMPPEEIGKNPFFMPVLEFQPADEGSGYVLRTATSLNFDHAAKTYFVSFPNFIRGEHEGIFESPIVENSWADYHVYPRLPGRSPR